jgi:hypothetical protein
LIQTLSRRLHHPYTAAVLNTPIVYPYSKIIPSVPPPSFLLPYVDVGAGEGVAEAELAAAGDSIVAWVGATVTPSELSSVGVGTALFVATYRFETVWSSIGVGAFNGVGADGATPGGAVEADLNVVGTSEILFVSGATIPAVLNAVGTGEALFISGVVAGSVLNAIGSAFAFFIGVDGNAPVGDAPNNFVPIRYVVGITANVVPVETVVVDFPGVVPCRIFVGPDNVVPVREVVGEVPRVKVRLV